MPERKYDPALGEAVRAMRVGETRAFPVPEGKTARDLSVRLSNWAIRAWGAGSHTVATAGSDVRITRLLPGAAKPFRAPHARERAEPLPRPVAPGGMGREQAAAWLSRYIPGGITAEQLARLDAKGRGPVRYRAGRTAVYFEADLSDWLRVRFRLAGGPPRAA